MSRVERKEYQETKVMRTAGPTRYGSSSSTQNISQFDNSLDNLLEDLQSTISRPGSAMTNSNGYRDTSRSVRSTDSSHRSNSMSRITNLKPANPVTEYSTDDSYTYTAPDGTQHVKTVKKESYSYKTSGEVPPEKIRMQNNINQLDSLLDDLQQVKQSGFKSNNNLSSDSTNYQEYSKNKVTSGKRVIERDVPYSDRSRSLDRGQREIYHRNEGTYGDIKSIRTTNPSPTRSNTSTITKVQSYPVNVIETTTPDINPEILASLDPELLPSGNTKVTTTIKTYTYEIPGSQNSFETEKIAYSPNQTVTTPSKSFTYNKYENRGSTSSPVYVPTSPKSDRRIIKETVTSRNYQPGKVYPEQQNGHTYVYNERTVNRNYNESNRDSPRLQHPSYPTHSSPPTRNTETYYVKETRNDTSLTNRSDSPDHTSLPPVNTTIHKFDSLTNLNARQYPEVETFDPRHPPSPEVNLTYKYKSTSNTTNSYRTGYPGEDEPLLPRRFPTGEADGPPKKLDDLMASIGNEPPTNAYNVGWKVHEEDMAQQRKVESLKAHQDFEARQKEDKKDLPATTKNVSGPPVYYPPGHELFAKKEESGAWRAEGAMAKEKGKYKYEAESKSKTKSSSGAAVVPICLPLCCGLPCTII